MCLNSDEDNAMTESTAMLWAQQGFELNANTTVLIILV